MMMLVILLALLGIASITASPKMIASFKKEGTKNSWTVDEKQYNILIADWIIFVL